MVVGNSLLYVLVQRRAWGVDKDRARAGGGGGSKNLRCCVRCREACRSVGISQTPRGQRQQDNRSTTNNGRGGRQAVRHQILDCSVGDKGKRKKEKEKKKKKAGKFFTFTAGGRRVGALAK
jgi:hypothetical protein